MVGDTASFNFFFLEFFWKFLLDTYKILEEKELIFVLNEYSWFCFELNHF